MSQLLSARKYTNTRAVDPFLAVTASVGSL